jgi:BON domain
MVNRDRGGHQMHNPGDQYRRQNEQSMAEGQNRSDSPDWLERYARRSSGDRRDRASHKEGQGDRDGDEPSRYRGQSSQASNPYGSPARRQRRFGDDRDDQYGGGGQYAGKGPKGYARSDDRIREDINEALSQDPDVDASDVDVHVTNGEVVLSGFVSSRGEKRAAEDATERCAGVTDVQNRITVRSA